METKSHIIAEPLMFIDLCTLDLYEPQVSQSKMYENIVQRADYILKEFYENRNPLEIQHFPIWQVSTDVTF